MGIDLNNLQKRIDKVLDEPIEIEIRWYNDFPNIFPSYGYYINGRFARVFFGSTFLNRNSINEVAKKLGFPSYKEFLEKNNSNIKIKI